MATYRAVQLSRPKGDFELVTREVPAPAAGEVLIRVEACGICHSDIFIREGLWPGIQYPRVPGHEVVGRIEKTGAGVTAWKPGQRVGAGWHAGHCFVCDPCRRGDFISCVAGAITGITRDGGYAEYMTASQHAIALVPDELDSLEAAPLLCAGITTFNALRNSGARAGDLVAILGVGGLGHLGVQFAAKMGFDTVAVSAGAGKERLARELGARHFIDTEKSDPAKELQKLGGARVILATAPNSKAITALVNGLGVNGHLVVVGASMEPIEVSPIQLIPGRRAVSGWPSGHARDSEDTLNFSALAGVRARIETYPLEQAAEAYERAMSNKARFRVVLRTA